MPKDWGGSQLDYFCQMVDYMKASMGMRQTWQLSEKEQKSFEGFDYVSNKVFEDDLQKAHDALSANANAFGAGAGF